MWIPDIDSPMSVFTPTELNKKCFAGLVSGAFDKSTGKFVPVNRPGVKVHPVGFTPGSVDGSKCGTTGIQSLIPGVINPEATQYFKAITDRFVAMGYIAGLTMQPLPYDFRMSSGYDEASKNLDKVAKKLKQFTNKKVIIVAHSHGNLKAAFNL